MATTGERIKQARLALGMTQTELADKVGVKFSAIHKYENGLVVNLKRDTIEALATALCVKPSYLMCMDDPTDISSTEEPSNADRILFNALKGATDAEKLQAAKIIEALRK